MNFLRVDIFEEKNIYSDDQKTLNYEDDFLTQVKA